MTSLIVPASTVAKNSRSFNALVDRLLIVGATYAYALSIFISYKLYLFPLWGYFGFVYSEPQNRDFFFAFIMLTVASASLPRTFLRPSSVILFFMYAVVFVPTIVVTLCLSADTLVTHWRILLSLTFAFVMCSLTSRLQTTTRSHNIGYPGHRMVNSFLILWLLIAILNIAVYHSVMGFAGIETAYEQREAGASKNALTAYSQTLFSSVINPTIFVLGLVYRKKIYVWIGILGSLLIYSISAQKTILLLPMVIYAFYKFLSVKSIRLKTPAAPLALLAVLTLVASMTYEENELIWLFAALFVFRTIAVPGLTYSQYHEFFFANGYTFWSHVKGFSSFVPTPSIYANDPLWPGLGYMIGEFAYGRSDLNANANLFSGDGVAAAGWAGVLIIGLLFSIWLKALDLVATKWSPKFVALGVMPLAISFTNGHFFTNLLSFGGLAWLFILLFFRPQYSQGNAEISSVK
jgi:hypothetical protein